MLILCILQCSFSVWSGLKNHFQLSLNCTRSCRTSVMRIWGTRSMWQPWRTWSIYLQCLRALRRQNSGSVRGNCFTLIRYGGNYVCLFLSLVVGKILCWSCCKMTPHLRWLCTELCVCTYRSCSFEGCLTVHLPREIIWNANLMQQGDFINVFLARRVSGTYAHHQEH